MLSPLLFFLLPDRFLGLLLKILLRQSLDLINYLLLLFWSSGPIECLHEWAYHLPLKRFVEERDLVIVVEDGRRCCQPVVGVEGHPISFGRVVIGLVRCGSPMPCYWTISRVRIRILLGVQKSSQAV